MGADDALGEEGYWVIWWVLGDVMDGDYGEETWKVGIMEGMLFAFLFTDLFCCLSVGVAGLSFPYVHLYLCVSFLPF